MKSLSTKWVDYLILGCAFFLIVHTLDGPGLGASASSPYGATAGTGTLGKQVGFILLLCYGLVALATNRAQAFTLKTVSAVLAIVFLAFITLSLGWSIDAHASMTRLFGFFTYVLAASGAVKRLGIRDVLRWYVFAQSSYLVLGVINEVRLQAFHPLTSWYRFSGIADDNATGNDAVVLAFASIAMLRSAPSSRLYRTALVLAIIILLLTKSRTALFSMIFALLIVYCFVAFRGLKLSLYFYGLILFFAFPFVLQTLDVFHIQDAVGLGRSDTSDEALNGRFPLWTELYTDFAEGRPMLGYGYGAFWTPNRIEDISTDQGWSIAAAHSIYMDALLAIGFCGAAVYLATLFSLFAKAVKLARSGSQEGYFFACLLCAVLFDGFSDSEPWFVSSIYLFGSIQAVFVLNSLVIGSTSLVKAQVNDSPGELLACQPS
ncbi:MAG: O-antigen ligase family protein [Janthinobacterium lividum]